MKRIKFAVCSAVLLLAFSLARSWAQQTTAAANGAVAAVPHLMKFSGSVKDLNGKPLTGVAGLTFALYKDQEGGAALWIETQNVQLDTNGRYSITLGSTKTDGLPSDLFISGEARWLGVQPEGQAEHPRVLLLSVPYALKAGDAETIGGLPPSAFVLAASSATPSGDVAGGNTQAQPQAGAVTGSGTANYVPLWTSTSNIGNSVLYQSGSGSSAKLGIDLTSPDATLDVNGSLTARGTLLLHSLGTATASSGFNSNPLLLTASSFNSSKNKAISENFQWQAEPVGNDTASASGTLNLLFGASGTPTETGLKIGSNGVINFASGQTFPGTGPGTVKSVGLTAPSSDFTVTGSPVTSTGTLNIAWTVAPTSSNTANTIVKRDASGNFAGNTITAGTLNAGAVTATSATLSSSLFINTAASVPLFVGSSAGNATVIEGSASATTGSAWGVEGITASSSANAYGVYGVATSTTGNPRGVYGLASAPVGIGVFGQNGTESATGAGNNDVVGAGVWGDGGTAGGFGVLATVDDGVAGEFENNTDSKVTVEILNFNANGLPFYAVTPNGFCGIDNRGDLNCTGSKNAVVPIDGGKRIVAMSAIESPQNWFEDFGSAQLTAGSAVVAIDPDFAQTVNTATNYMVIPVPNGECKGLYVTNKTPTSFEVRELGGGTSSIQFDYRMVVLRKNYENVRFADHTNDPDPRKMMLKRSHPVSLAAQPEPVK